MGKIAFVFPGQGAQVTGMGKDFFEQYDEAKEVFEIASKASGLEVDKLCFTENDQLNITEYTQIAMLACEVAILKVCEKKGLLADCCAGLSLGEYGALAAANVMDLSDLFYLIRQRGIYMQKAYPEGGAMTAVLGAEQSLVEDICKNTEGIVSVANYNCPGQIVITGEKEAVDAAAAKLAEAGAKRCISLNVSGPFHCELLNSAKEKLADCLESIEVRNPQIPYYCNVEAVKVTDNTRIKELLANQVVDSVRWQQCVEQMLADGVDTFIEIGPGKTLSGFMKKINKEVKSYNIATVEALEGVLEELSC